MKPKKQLPKQSLSDTVDAAEISKFEALAEDWWNPEGAMAPLHRMNPCRLEFITTKLRQHFDKIENISILDVGCGGGLTAEPLARLGAKVTGIDGAESLIKIARAHADMEKLTVDYRHGHTGDLLKDKKRYDVVLALEVIEHVTDTDQFVDEISKLVVPHGLVIFSTLNRTPASLALGVVAAEYILRWLPRGTHDWKKFVKPSELHTLCLTHGLTPQEAIGMVYNPLTQSFSLDERRLSVNYLLSTVKA
jgi:2-polyprenyl-6-hydroxyphenyl methylase / 3-demethylubiquinone-9 3-methyltransferase